MNGAEFFLRVFETLTTFVASMWASLLSWPVAFVLVVLIYYRPLRRLIGQVKSGKFGSVEFNVAEELVEAEAAATDAEAGITTGLQPSTAEDDTEKAQTGAVPEDPEEIGRSTSEGWARTNAVIAESKAVMEESRQVSERVARSWFADQLRGDERAEEDRSKRARLRSLIKAYDRLEAAIAEAHARYPANEDRSQANSFEQVFDLYLHGIVDGGFVESYQRLQRIRERVLREDADFSSSEAQAFGKIAEKLRRILAVQLSSDG